MKEMNRVAARTEAEEAGTGDPIDETTRQVLDDYSRKFLGFIQQEKERIRKQSLQESERLLAEAEKKGRLAYEGAVERANQESESILGQCRERANHIVAEAQRLFQAVVELRDKTQRDIDDLRDRLEREVSVMVESIEKNGQAMSEAKTILGQEFDASAAAIAQAMQGVRPTSRHTVVEPTVVLETTEVPKERAVSEQPQVKPAPKQQDDPTRKQSEKTFVGTLNFDIDKGSAALYRRFKEALSKVPGLDISMAEDLSKDKARIVAFASRPMMLMNVLHQMSLVKSATAEKGSVEVVLQEPDRWIG